MTDNHVGGGKPAVDATPEAGRGGQATSARSAYAPPTVVKMRLESIVGGVGGSKFDSTSQPRA